MTDIKLFLSKHLEASVKDKRGNKCKIVGYNKHHDIIIVAYYSNTIGFLCLSSGDSILSQTPLSRNDNSFGYIDIQDINF